MSKNKIIIALVMGSVGGIFAVYYLGYDLIATLSTGWPLKVAGSVITLFLFFVFYRLSARAIKAAISKAGGTEGDIKMLIGLWRIAVAFIAVLVILGAFFQLGILTAAFGAFGGLFLGWSLQPVVSGFAAWVLVTLKRPFRVGDRVQLPSHGLVGDVEEVGPMYTVLNQVGGAVGSEEPVGRHVLIPNAMLFGNLVINYTPKIGEERKSSSAMDKTREFYILDEVIVRITFDSDWTTAENIMLNAARDVTAGIIKETGQDPYIRSDMYDYGVYLRLRYITLATDRPRIKYEIEKKVFEEFQKNEKVDFAIPYVYSARKGAEEASSS